MAESLYLVREADYYDEQDGVAIGSTVTATPGENPALLYITALADRTLDAPIAVRRDSLVAQ